MASISCGRRNVRSVTLQILTAQLAPAETYGVCLLNSVTPHFADRYPQRWVDRSKAQLHADVVFCACDIANKWQPNRFLRLQNPARSTENREYHAILLVDTRRLQVSQKRCLYFALR